MDAEPAAIASGAVLGVSVGGTQVGLPAHCIAEIIRPPALTRVPQAPPVLLGLGNLRGTVLPVVCLARLLGRPEAPATAAARVVVLQRAAPVGLLVDAVTAMRAGGEAVPLDDLLDRLGGHFAAPAARQVATARATGEGRAKPQSGTSSLLVFAVGGQDYALPLDDVEEVIPLTQQATALPGADPALLGAAAARAGLLPLVSLRVLLGQPPDVPDAARARVIVTRIGTALAGLVVDGVRAIARVAETSCEPVPPVLTRGLGEARLHSICRLPAGGLAIVLSPETLFDNATSSRLLEAAGAAAESAGAEPEEAGEQFIVFRLGTENYGLPMAAVSEILRRPAALARVPHAPDFLAGLMNLHGAAVPVIDQHKRFGIAAGNSRLVVVVASGGRQAGILVDGVSAPLRATAAELAAAPLLSSGTAPVFDRVAGISRQGRMTLLIDPSVLLDEATQDLLSAFTAQAEAA